MDEEDGISERIFLVKSGQFRSTIKIPVTDDEKVFKDLFVNNKLNIDAYKNDVKNQSFKLHAKKFRQVEVCVHQEGDLFGYQDLLISEDEKASNPTVIAMGDGATIISIGKQYMAKHIRSNIKVYIDLINRWNHLVKTRIKSTLLGYKAVKGDKYEKA